MARPYSSSRIIYAGRGDDVAAIIEKLQRAPGPSGALVANNCPALQSRENLRDLQAQAAQQELELTLVCGDRAARAMADDLGIRVVASLGALHAQEQPSRGAAGTAKAAGEKEALPAAERTIHTTPGKEPGSGLAEPRGRRTPPPLERSLARVLAWATLIVVVLFGIWGVLYLVLPSARVELTPVQQQYTTELQLIADPQVSRFNAATGQMPAKLVVLEETEELTVAATGKRDVAVGRAEGSVVFRNRISQPVSVPKGTVVLTDDNRRFETADNLTIPPTSGASDTYGMRRVGIVAMDSGPGANVDAGAITHIDDQSLNQRLEVNNDSPILGGGMRASTFVTEQDRLQLYDQLRHTLRQRLYEKIGESIDPREYALVTWQEDVIVEQATYDREVGEEAEQVTLRMRMKLRGTAYSNTHLAEIAPLILARIVENQLDSYMLVPETVSLSTPEAVELADGVFQLKLTAQSDVVSTWDLGKVRRELTNVTRAEAEAYLDALTGVGDFELEMGPDWYERMPRLWFRIAIDVQSPLQFAAEG